MPYPVRKGTQEFSCGSQMNSRHLAIHLILEKTTPSPNVRKQIIMFIDIDHFYN